MHPSWEVFEALCEKEKVYPSVLFRSLGFPVSLTTNWKKGISYPKYDKLLVLAEHFGIGVNDFYV